MASHGSSYYRVDMAFDEGLAERIRTVLAGRETVHEQRMFGGIAFMDRGNMVVGITRDELMARVGGDSVDQWLGEPGAHLMHMGDRVMSGMIGVSPEGVATDQQLRTWIDRCFAFTDTLPAKG
jgi:TfoX/Sxy family transcriptional regulator of competence genes